VTAQIVAIQTEESFKGSYKGELFFLLQPGHDCAPKFKSGERILLYLNHSVTGLWEAFGCGRTQRLESAADDLRFLRALPGSATKTRFAGAIVLYENSVAEGIRRVRALSDVHVHLRSEIGSIEVTTGTDGVYEVYGLPPGNYRVSIDVPNGLKIHFPMIAGGEGRRSRLKDLQISQPIVRMDADSSADVDFLLMIDNQISGRVVDSAGRPVKDVCVQLQPARGEANRHFYVSKCSEANGGYVLKDMLSGQYIITAKPSVNRECPVDRRN
jgi:hypothetical protein